MSLLSLPEEVLVIILSSLRAPDILAFASVNKYACKFYSSSSRLQYIAELDAAGCLDPSLEAPYTGSSAFEQSDSVNAEKDDGSSKNAVPSTSISEKLAYLRTRENRWRELDLQRNAKKLPLKREIEVSIYDLSAGVFAFAENGRENVLDFVELKKVSMHPGIQNEDERKELGDELADEEESFFETEDDRIVLPSTAVPWQKFVFDSSVADFALSMKEHNLIVFVSYNPKEHENAALNLPSMQEIKLHLLDFTTRSSHTLAKEPMIKLTEKPATYRRPSPAIEVAGKYIVIALTFPRSVVATMIEDLFVINWHTGRIIHHQPFNNPTYCGIAFVTPSLFVLPNLRDNSLDLVHIFVNPNDTNGIEHVLFLRKLCLPELAPHFKLRSVVCRGDPNPTSSTPDILDPTQDVSTTSHKFQSREDWGSARYGITADPLRAIISFKFIIVNENAAVPYGPAVNLVIHRSTLASLALDGLNHRKRSFLTALPSSHVKSESNRVRIPSEEMLDVIPKVLWTSWGPEATRWKLEEDFVDWVTTTAGQRQVLTSLSTEWQPGIVVRDYNPYEVRRMRAKALSSRGEDMKEDRIQERQSKVKGKAKEGAEETNPGSTHGTDTEASEIHVHIDSIDGERDSDSEDEDELGMAGQLPGFFHGPLENQLATMEQIFDMVAPAPAPTSAPSPVATTVPVSVSTATPESSIPFPPSSASTGHSDAVPPSSPIAASQTSPHAPASGPSGTSSLLQQLWVEEGDQNGQGENGTSANLGAHEEFDNAVVPTDNYTDFNPGEEVPTQADHSQTPQSLSPQAQALKLTSIRIRDTTPSLKVRYYEAGQVQGGLPCVEYTIAGDESLYSGLLMDEERIIGYLESTANPDRTEKMVQMCVFSMYP